MEYAVKSYDVDAFYYLMKPVDQPKLYTVLDRACRTVACSRDAGLFEFKTAAVVRRLDPADITYADITDRAVCCHLRGGEAVIGRKLRGSFSREVAPLLEDRRFVICGAGMAVNLSAVEHVDDESVLLRGGVMLYPSRSACSMLKKQLAAYKHP